MPPPSADQLGAVESITAKRQFGSGFQYRVKRPGSDELVWVAASRVKTQFPLIVAAFERQAAAAAGGQQQPAPDAAAMAAQVATLQQQLRDQQDTLAAALKAAGASSAAQSSTSRFARKEPRAQDLHEYDGAPGAKLDEWLQELSLASELYELNDREAVKFASSRLRGPALQWWLAFDAAGRAALGTVDLLAAALRTRFQPITAARVARQQMDNLRQGSKGINDYIADFQRLRAQLPSMAEEDALYAFERGVHPSIALEMRKAGTQRVTDAIALAARIGGLTASSSSAPAGRSLAQQMDLGYGVEEALEERVTRAVLNAMQSQAGAGSGRAFGGLGAKPQTRPSSDARRGYEQARSGRGGARGGRFGGRNAGDAPRPPPTVPGVPPEVVAQRRAANQCFRCGDDNHRALECPNATSATASHSSN